MWVPPISIASTFIMHFSWFLNRFHERATVGGSLPKNRRPTANLLQTKSQISSGRSRAAIRLWHRARISAARSQTFRRNADADKRTDAKVSVDTIVQLFALSPGGVMQIVFQR